MQVGVPLPGRAPLSELFQRRPLDDVDALEATWAKSFKETEDALGNNAVESQATILQQWITGSAPRQATVTKGLLFGILMKPSLSKGFLQALLVMGEEQLQAAIALCRQLIAHAGHRLLVGPALQMVWAVDQLIRAQVPGPDPIVLALFRMLPPGDVSKTGCRIAAELFGMLSTHRVWLLQPANTPLLCAAVHTALSLLCTHAKYGIAPSVQAEVQFCQHVLRSQLRTVSTTIGRDFVRLLYAVCVLHKVGEMQEFWDLLVHHVSGTVDVALARPTPTQFLRLRLTVEVETKLMFIFHRVPYRHLRRYQSWFQQRFLSTAEQHLLLPDLIRYTCGAFHPTNEMLANSDLVPRWQMIGWWLKSVEGNRELQWQCEQAALWDWATYNILRRPHPPDSLMNLEPAMLVMHRSLPKHPEVTSLILSHLFAMMDHGLLPAPFVPQGSGPDVPHPITPAEVVDAVRGAMGLMVSRAVVRDLAHIYKCSRLDQRLRDVFMQQFRKQISSNNEALAARQQRQSPSGLAPSLAVAAPPTLVKLDDSAATEKRRAKRESDSESDTEAQRKQHGWPAPPLGRGRPPSPMEGDSSDSDSDVEHRLPATPNATLAALEPHLSTFATQAAALSGPWPDNGSAPPSDTSADSPLKRARRALEGLIGRFLRTDSHSLVGDLALWLLSQLAPDLRAAAADPELVAQQAFDPTSLPFLLLDSMLAYLVAADPAATAHDSRRSASHEHVMKRFANHRLPKLQVEGKLYQLLLGLENLDPLFSTRWLAVCLVHDGVVERSTPTGLEATWLLSSIGSVPALPGPSLVEPLQYYEDYCRHRVQINAEKVQQSLAIPSLSSTLPQQAAARLEMGAVITSDLLHAADQSKSLLLVVLPAVFRLMYNPRRAGSPNDLVKMLLEQDWLWVEDLYCLKVMLSGGIRLLADMDGSLLQLVEASLLWSPVSQKVLWDVIVHQAHCIAGAHFSSPSMPDAGPPSLPRCALFSHEGSIEPSAVAAFVSGVLDIKGLDPQCHRQPLCGVLSFDLSLLLRPKGADSAVSHLCARLLRLPASFGAFPAAMLLSMFGIRHHETAVTSSILDVLGDLLQRAQVPDAGHPTTADCRLLVHSAVEHLLQAFGCHEEGLRLLRSLMSDKARPLSALLKGLRARDLVPATAHQRLSDLLAHPDVQALQREGPASANSEHDPRRNRRRLKRLRRGTEEAFGSDDGDDDDTVATGVGGPKRRRKGAVNKKEDGDGR